MKKVISIILVMTMLIGTAIQGTDIKLVYAQEKPELTEGGQEQKELTGSCGKNAVWTYNLETKELVISGKGEINYEIKRTSKINGAKKVVIGEGITTIGDGVFQYFDFSEIRLPESLKRINEYAFYGCGNLKHITIPKNVTKIGHSAFGLCDKLKTITILGNINSSESFLDEGEDITLNLAGFCRPIGIMSVYNSLNIKMMPGNKKYVIKKGFIMSPDKKHLYLYTNKGKKKKSIVIPNTIEVVEPGAVAWRSNVKMGKNIKRIKQWGFYYCTFKTLKLPKNLKIIEAGGFARADMEKLIINDKLKYIGTGAFDDTSIKSLTINHDVVIMEKNFPGAKLKYTGKAKKIAVLQGAYYWDRKGEKDKASIEFLQVEGAKGYQVKILQPGRKIEKIFDTKSKKVKCFKDESTEGKNTVIIARTFKIKTEKANIWANREFKKGYALYTSVRPYKYKNGKKVYGKWSRKRKFVLDESGEFFWDE